MEELFIACNDLYLRHININKLCEGIEEEVSRCLVIHFENKGADSGLDKEDSMIAMTGYLQRHDIPLNKIRIYIHLVDNKGSNDSTGSER